MPKQIQQNTKYKLLQNAKAGLAVLLAIVVSCGIIASPLAQADSVQDQINQLRAENANNRSAVAQLEVQATSYQDAISKLNAQILQLQGQINANEVEQAKLQQQIVEAEAELAKQKKLLGENIKAMYLEGQITTLEMLASSKDLSEFVDKQQYRDSVKNKIKDTLDKVTSLKLALKTKKEGVELLLAQQKQQQAEVTSAQAQQAQLLAYNQQQQSDYNQKSRDNQSKIDALIASQRRANFNPDGGYYFIRFPGVANGFNPDAYPYRNAGFGMSPGPGCVDNDGPDPWGYCTRQCVSFAAWAVVASGRSAPMFWGNARDWVAAAYARGYEVSRSPQPGDVAISTSGYWGHAMYVQSVSGNSFYSLEYNGNLDGRPSNRTRGF